MDNNETCNSASFAKETGKTFVLATASSVGIWTGFYLVSLALEANARRKARKAQKSTPNET